MMNYQVTVFSPFIWTTDVYADVFLRCQSRMTLIFYQMTDKSAKW